MYTIAKYLLDRLSEIGIKHIFGVPGDFNLEFLDYVNDHEEIKWYGNLNELNAAYAADGYARVNGVSALLTTYGVGELSAFNGVAGSYAEDVPVINIVGVPNKEIITNNKMVHHSLGNNKYDAFKKAFENISAYQVWLDNKNAISGINEAIKHAIFYKKPVYIMLPADIIHLPTGEIKKEIDFGFHLDPNKINEIVDDLKGKIENSHQAVIITGHKVNSYGLNELLEKFVDKVNINVASSMFGKGSFNEENQNYIGIYTGKNTYDAKVKEFVAESDLVITIGVKFTDLSSSNFQLNFDRSKWFEIDDEVVRYDNKTVTHISMGAILNQLNRIEIEYSGNLINNKKEVAPFFVDDSKLSFNRFFEALNAHIRKNDILVSDVGTCMFGMQHLQLKANSTFIMQPLWASIGFSFPAAIGAKLASDNQRVINVIGDGAFNMTFNELATIMDKRINNIVFLINNRGYTIERVIHGLYSSYNDTPEINYQALVKAFDSNNSAHLYFKVTTEKELYEALMATESTVDKLIFVEVVVEQMDLPKQLKNVF